MLLNILLFNNEITVRINYCKILFLTLLLWSSFGHATNPVLVEAATTCAVLRDDDGWVKYQEPQKFFAKNLQQNIQIIHQRLSEIIDNAGVLVDESERIVAQSLNIIDAIKIIADSHNELALYEHVFYNKMIVKLADIIVDELHLLNQRQKSDWTQVDAKTFLTFAETATPLHILELQNQVFAIGESDNSATRVSLVVELSKNRTNFSSPQWFYEACRRMIDVNFCVIHTAQPLNEADINFALSQQIGVIGMIIPSIQFDGRSSGPEGFADHDFTCHIIGFDQLYLRLQSAYFLNSLLSLEEKAGVEDANWRSVKSYFVDPDIVKLPVQLWTFLQKFYQAIASTNDEALRKQLELGFFVTHHEAYNFCDSANIFVKGGEKFYRWLDKTFYGGLLPEEVFSATQEVIETYVSELFSTYNKFREEWWLNNQALLSDDEKAIWLHCQRLASKSHQ